MKSSNLLLLLVAALMTFGCVKPFDTPAVTSDNSILVLDGFLDADSVSVVKLTRTRSLSDTGAAIGEPDAQVMVEAASGGRFAFTYSGDGVYKLENTPLPVGGQYRLSIRTSNGKEYLSDLVDMRRTPPIDSIEWDQHDDIFFYVNTHDVTGNTRYYRWDFTETAEYHTAFDSHLDFKDGELIFIEPEAYRYTCYNTFNSTNILIGSTAAFGADVISHQLINRIPNDNTKISVRYSIIVRQYSLTAQSYEYWNTLKQNSENVGGLFDPQPSQLQGNIHCITNPEEPVLGYLSASSVTSLRIFLRNNQLTDRKPITEDDQCKATIITNTDTLEIMMRSQPYLPAYFSGGILAVAPAYCVDCRLRGGTTAQPSFW